MGATATKPTAPASVHFAKRRAEFPRMDNKTVAITGSTSGLGFVAAKVCGELGARILMVNRDSERAEKAVQALKDAGIENVIHVTCDLTSFASVREAGAKIRELCKDEGLDVLCNNAGVMGVPDKATPDGYDIQMQSNHLSHFLLTAEVWPVLEKAASLRGEARVVNHSSGARKKPNYGFDPVFLGPNGGNLGGDWWSLAKWKRYQQSKLANLLYTYALHEHATADREKKGEGAPLIKVLCAHPGATLTDLQMKTAQQGGTSYLDTYVLNMTMNNAHSEEDGALGILRAMLDKDAESAQFYGPNGYTGDAILLPAERNPEAEKVLWELSEKATGAKYFQA
eukprot:Colp12_sorted_trinity150504_noHs@4256